MTGRVLVKPDADGVIRVRCGDSIIEVEVDTSGHPSAAGGGHTGGGSKADDPIVALRVADADQLVSVTWVGVAASRVDRPHAWAAANTATLSALADQARQVARDTPGPDAPVVRLDADALDVHFIDRLGSSLEAGGDYTIVVDLSHAHSGAPA
jgi:hypothetical protein